ncbi:MAG: hypothetical protein FJ150_00070 [Euryarchaeota archaeon]|nr:hypothetical protein [Euryarchaeota archaeon]
MNFRVVLVAFIIITFSFGFGILSYLESPGISLKQAYEEGNVEVVQNTTAGNVPHSVMMKNIGDKPVIVEKGDMITSNESQDLVIAENKKIAPNSSATVKAYCAEPNQMAIIRANLKPSGKTNDQIQQIIENSDPYNAQNAMRSQIQIWIIVSGGDVNPYAGEAIALTQKQNISFYDLRQNISTAKVEVMTKFNLTTEQLKSLQNRTIAVEQSPTWIDRFITWIRESLGI